LLKERIEKLLLTALLGQSSPAYINAALDLWNLLKSAENPFHCGNPKAKLEERGNTEQAKDRAVADSNQFQDMPGGAASLGLIASQDSA
jgi:hypothetical protein